MEVQTLKGVDFFLFQPLVGRGIYTVVRQTNQKTMKIHHFMVKTCKGCIDSISWGTFDGEQDFNVVPSIDWESVGQGTKHRYPLPQNCWDLLDVHPRILFFSMFIYRF